VDFTKKATRRFSFTCVNTARAFANAAKETKINQQDKRKAAARGRTFAPV
jgi:hypothetical protein